MECPKKGEGRESVEPLVKFLLGCFRKKLIYVVPVYDIPKRVNVRTAVILVLQVVGVLPYVAYEKRDRGLASKEVVFFSLHGQQLITGGVVD